MEIWRRATCSRKWIRTYGERLDSFRILWLLWKVRNSWSNITLLEQRLSLEKKSIPPVRRLTIVFAALEEKKAKRSCSWLVVKSTKAWYPDRGSYMKIKLYFLATEIQRKSVWTKESPRTYQEVHYLYHPVQREYICNFGTFLQIPDFMPQCGNLKIGPYLDNRCP